MNTIPQYHYIVYLVWNIDNGMIYVGQHRTYNVNDSYMGSGSEITKIYAQYKRKGLKIQDHFQRIVLYDFDNFDEMNKTERLIVDDQFVKNPFTYNKVIGGAGNNLYKTGKLIQYKNCTYSISQWAEILGIDKSTIKARLYAGWTIKDIIEKPLSPRSVLYEYYGEYKTLREWAQYKHISYMTLHARINRLGWTIYEAIDKKSYENTKQYTVNGKTMNLKNWAKLLGIPLNTLSYRINRLGWSPEKALTTTLK